MDSEEAMGNVLLREQHGVVERLILNRPESENMLNDDMRSALMAAFSDIGRKPEIRVVILTGSGGIFSRCADGMEMGEKYMHSPQDYRSVLWNVRNVAMMMRSLPKPIIGAVNGLATMGGFELALSCDFIVASRTASLGDGHPSGIGGGGGSQRLLELIGAPMTRWLLYTQEVLTAQRAYEIGLVQQLYDPDTFDASVLQLANDIAARRIGHSLERIKALTASREPTLASLNFEIEHSIDHWLSPEATAMRAQWAEAAKAQ
jgi:enoyl-CoA hydratase/carnithine racemase